MFVGILSTLYILYGRIPDFFFSFFFYLRSAILFQLFTLSFVSRFGFNHSAAALSGIYSFFMSLVNNQCHESCRAWNIKHLDSKLLAVMVLYSSVDIAASSGWDVRWLEQWKEPLVCELIKSHKHSNREILRFFFVTRTLTFKKKHFFFIFISHVWYILLSYYFNNNGTIRWYTILFICGS